MPIHPTLQQRQSRSLAMTADLRRAIGFLRCTNREIAAQVAVLAKTNPHLNVRRTSMSQTLWASIVDPAGSQGKSVAAPGAVGPSAAGPARDGEDIASAAPGLLAHVLAQLNLLVRDPADRQVALAFAAALEPSGWLSCPVPDIARDCGCSVAAADSVLAQLQQIEPAGLFARSLADCLRLQAADRGLLTAEFDCLLDNLPMLAGGDLAGVAARCGCDVGQVAQMLRTIRTMNPKPGADFDAGPSPVREPDLVVWKNEGDWMVALNRSNLPSVRVVEKPERTGAEDSLRAARWLERAVSRRNATTLRIAREVVAHQSAFLTHGPLQMRPLSFAEVAEKTGLHVSTISRVTLGLLVSTPAGTMRFRDFFSAALDASGTEVALAAILHELRALIAAEPADRPLSDQDIADYFAARGVRLARRTVAKHRGRLKIPASAQRRRYARLNANL